MDFPSQSNFHVSYSLCYPLENEFHPSLQRTLKTADLLFRLRRFPGKSVCLWWWGVSRLPDRQCSMRSLSSHTPPSHRLAQKLRVTVQPKTKGRGRQKSASFRLLLNNRCKSGLLCMCVRVCVWDLLLPVSCHIFSTYFVGLFRLLPRAFSTSTSSTKPEWYRFAS